MGKCIKNFICQDFSYFCYKSNSSVKYYDFLWCTKLVNALNNSDQLQGLVNIANKK